MTDWNRPQTEDNHIDIIEHLKARDEDAARMFDSTGSNVPNGAIRWRSAQNRFERWNGSSWQKRIISVSGGGTGSDNATGIAENIGSVSASANTLVARNNSGQVNVEDASSGSHAVNRNAGDSRYARRSNNLSDLNSASSARDNIGLGSMATRNTGTAANQHRTNSQMDDRYTQRSNNLSDLESASTSRDSLGLGSAAVQNDDRYLHRDNNLSDLDSPEDSRNNLGVYSTSEALAVENNLSDVQSVSTSRGNLGLGNSATRDFFVSQDEPDDQLGEDDDVWFQYE